MCPAPDPYGFCGGMWWARNRTNGESLWDDPSMVTAFPWHSFFTMYILYYYQATEKWALWEGWSWGQCTLFVLKLVAFKACYKTGACHVVPPWYLRNPFFVCAEIWDFEIKVDLCFSFACLIDQTRCLFGQGFPLWGLLQIQWFKYLLSIKLRGVVQCNSFNICTKLYPFTYSSVSSTKLAAS